MGKPRIAVVTWCYAGDADLAVPCARSVALTAAANPSLEFVHHFVDDKNAPMGSVPPGTVRLETSCPRGRGLRGADFIAEACALYGRLACGGFDYIVKLDADTCLASVPFVGRDYYGGVWNGEPPYATGQCYALSAKAALALAGQAESVGAAGLAELDSRHAGRGEEGLGEDVYTGILLKRAGIRVEGPAVDEPLSVQRFWYGRDLYRIREPFAVSCKRYIFSRDKSSEDSLERVRERMEAASRMALESVRVGIATFCYGGDAVLLAEKCAAVRRLQRAFPRRKILHIVLDDGFKPLPAAPDADLYLRTDYDRRGNLNGEANIRGQSATLLRAVDALDLGAVLKSDCDNLVLNPGLVDAMLESGAEYAGTSPDQSGSFALGGCYALTAEGVRKLARHWRDADYGDAVRAASAFAAWPEGEDVLTAAAAKAAGLKRLVRRRPHPGALLPCTPQVPPVHALAQGSSVSTKADYNASVEPQAVKAAAGRMRLLSGCAIKPLRLGVFTFTHAGDESLLPICAESVRRASECFPEVETVHYVADDGAAPVSAYPEGTVGIRTDWPRGGNNNGAEAVMGELSLYAERIRKDGLDAVLKLDTDTVLLDPRPALCDMDALGSGGAPEPSYPWGGAALYSAKAILYALDAAPAALEGRGRVPEDLFIGQLVKGNADMRCSLGPVNSPGGLSLCFRMGSRPNPAAMAATCKGRPGRDRWYGCTREEASLPQVAARMRRILDAALPPAGRMKIGVATLGDPNPAHERSIAEAEAPFDLIPLGTVEPDAAALRREAESRKLDGVLLLRGDTLLCRPEALAVRMDAAATSDGMGGLLLNGLYLSARGLARIGDGDPAKGGAALDVDTFAAREGSDGALCISPCVGDPINPKALAVQCSASKRIGVFTFTCAKDAPLLSACIESVRRASRTPGVEFIHYIVDDASDPVPEPPAEETTLRYSRGTWERGWKNTGAAAVFGELGCYAEAVKRDRLDAVLKLDTDTVLMNPAPLLGRWDVYGSCNGDDGYPWGAAALYSARAVRYAVRAAARGVDPSLNPAEDLVIGRLAASMPGARVHIGRLGGSGELALYYAPRQPLDPRALAATCKGRTKSEGVAGGVP